MNSDIVSKYKAETGLNWVKISFHDGVLFPEALSLHEIMTVRKTCSLGK